MTTCKGKALDLYEWAIFGNRLKSPVNPAWSAARRQRPVFTAQSDKPADSMCSYLGRLSNKFRTDENSLVFE